MGTSMVELRREELDVWLGEPDNFVLAVLRDIYDNDYDVTRWLNTPRPELSGFAPADLISLGRVAEVESALIQHWNAR